MKKDNTSKIYELMMERQVQDQVIAQLRLECSKLRNQLQENANNGYHKSDMFSEKVSLLQNHQQKYFEVKQCFIETITAILDNLRLECQGLKVQLLDLVEQIKGECFSIIAKTVERTKQIQDESRYETVTQNKIIMKLREQIMSQQTQIRKMTQNLKDSQANEISLLEMNKKQQFQLESLSNRILSPDESESNKLSRTATDWSLKPPQDIVKKNSDSSSQIHLNQKNMNHQYRSFSHISLESHDMQLTRKHGDKKESVYSTLREKLTDSLQRDLPYLRKLSNKYLGKQPKK